MPTQVQLFYQEQRNIAEGNALFLELVDGGLTREELDRCIERRPQFWSRFASYRELLPTSALAQTPPAKRPDLQHQGVSHELRN